MARWVIYSTCSIVALCSMGSGAVDFTVPEPSAQAGDAARLPTAGELPDGAGEAAATGRTRRPTRG
jgi:hypothetical protein